MRTPSEILSDLKNRFEKRVQDKIADGSVLDFYNTSVSETLGDVYAEIDKYRNPHIWSKLYGSELDDMGTMLNIPRKANEDDLSYRYRIMNWVLTNEASNETAINDALLNPKYASNIEFKSCTKGCGTASCYIIPRDYSIETIRNALQEAEGIITKVADPTIHVEYIIPAIRGVQLQIFLSVRDDVDEELVKQNIEKDIQEYINTIPPKEYLNVGTINKIGIGHTGVEYFSVLSMMINDETVDRIKVVQELDSKFIFDNVIWMGED